MLLLTEPLGQCGEPQPAYGSAQCTAGGSCAERSGKPATCLPVTGSGQFARTGGVTVARSWPPCHRLGLPTSAYSRNTSYKPAPRGPHRYQVAGTGAAAPTVRMRQAALRVLFATGSVAFLAIVLAIGWTLSHRLTGTQAAAGAHARITEAPAQASARWTCTDNHEPP